MAGKMGNQTGGADTSFELPVNILKLTTQDELLISRRGDAEDIARLSLYLVAVPK